MAVLLHRIAHECPEQYLLWSGLGKASWATVQDPKCAIIIHDALKLEQARLKVKYDGNPDGHRGVRSIKNFYYYFRIQIGLGRVGDAKEHVLGPLSAFEKSYFSLGRKGTDEASGYIDERIEEGSR